MPSITELINDRDIKTFPKLKEHPNPNIRSMGEDYDEDTELKHKRPKEMLRMSLIIKNLRSIVTF